MVPVILFTLSSAMAYAVDDAAKTLAADARLALKRADVSQDFLSRVIRAPKAKVSEQLSGQQPFTLLPRILTAKEIRDTEFWREFLDIQEARLGRAVIAPPIVAELIAKVDALLGSTPKPVQKMDLTPRTRTVELPLRKVSR